METAGTLLLPLTCDLLSCSPKLSNSTPTNDPRDPSGQWAERHEARRWRPEILSKLIQQSVRTQWKFVVSSQQDLAEIDQMLAEVPPERPEDVFLMPEGVTVPEPERVRWIVELCQKRGWCYGHRLHIALFGNTFRHVDCVKNCFPLDVAGLFEAQYSLRPSGPLRKTLRNPNGTFCFFFLVLHRAA